MGKPTQESRNETVNELKEKVEEQQISNTHGSLR